LPIIDLSAESGSGCSMALKCSQARALQITDISAWSTTQDKFIPPNFLLSTVKSKPETVT
jgi:hypothetical protein